jgi:hypothetical protein
MITAAVDVKKNDHGGRRRGDLEPEWELSIFEPL